MEEGDQARLADFKKFLHGFVNDGELSSSTDDQIPFRGSIVGSFRLPASDVPAEVLDWVLLYLHQRKCPHDLASILARDVQTRIENLLPSIVPPIPNGGSGDADSPEEGIYMLDSSMLQSEMMSQLQQVCCQLRNSDTELLHQMASLKEPQYQTSLVAVKNVRRKMEDRHVLIHDLNSLCGLVDGPAQSYYAVFDGHSGVEAASFCSAHLHWNLVQHPKFECDPETAIRDAFATTEEQFLKRSQREGIKSGSTAVCCLIREKSLYVAWLGDSQAILVRKGMPETLMSPHKPERIDERERIEKEGGCVMYVGTWRVNGILAVSRALGDFEHKPCISSEPEIVQLDLDGEEDFLVIACDGLWDVLTANDVTAAIYHYINQQHNDIDEIATQLSQQAIERGSADNITVIIVFLRDLQTLVAQSAVTSFSSDSFSNHRKSNTFEELESCELNSRLMVMEGGVIENGDGEYNLGMRIGDPISTNGPEEIFHPRGGLMPETTLISELPTPPIEDLVGTEAFNAQLDLSQGSLIPFVTQDIEVHDHHAKEFASEILSSALASAANTYAGLSPILETSFDRPTIEQTSVYEPTFFSGQQEMASPLESVAEGDNSVSAPKPWVLQVEHSAQPDVVDYLPSGGSFQLNTTQTLTPKSPELFSDDSFDNKTYLCESTSFEIKAEVDNISEKLGTLRIDSTSNFVFNQSNTVTAEDEVDHSNVFTEQIQESAESPLLANVNERVNKDLTHFEQFSEEAIKEQDALVSEVPLVEAQYSAEQMSQFQETISYESKETNIIQEQIVSSKSNPFGDSDNPFGDFEAQATSGFSNQSHQPQSYSGFDPFATFSEETTDQNYNPFGQSDSDLYTYSEETPSTLRPIQGVPEMIGISEAVPGIQTSEPLVAPETFMTSQKEVLAAFEDILAPGSPEQPPAATIKELLQPPNNNIFESASFEIPDVQEELVSDIHELPETLETSDNVLNLMASAPEPPVETPNPSTCSSPNTEEPKISPVFENKPISADSGEKEEMESAVKGSQPVSDIFSAATTPVQNNLLVDFLAPQMNVPDLTSSEVVASLLASDVPPTPEVILEKIPDGVPEADGVTEDSDSEKDGGWSYVSGKGKDPSAGGVDSKKTKSKSATNTTVVKKSATATLSKETAKVTPISKLNTMKQTDAKLKVKPTTIVASSTATMKKSPAVSADTAKRPLSAISAKPKPTQSSLSKPATGSAKTNTISKTTTLAAPNKNGETKTTITKTSTLTRPAPAPTKKPIPKSSTITGTNKSSTTTTTTTTTGTIKSTTTTTSKVAATGISVPRPKSATTAAAPREASSTLARPIKSATTTRPATATTLPKKTTVATSKPSTLAPKVPSTRAYPNLGAPPVSKLSRPEVKQTKDTVNKQLVKTSGTLQNKPSTNTSPAANSPTNRTATLSKSSTLSKPGTKTLRPGTTAGKTTQKPVAKNDSQGVVKTLKQEEQVKPEPEKGSLEDKGKDNHAVDSGLASPESPVSPQLSMVNGNHSGDAPIEEKTDMREQAELN